MPFEKNEITEKANGGTELMCRRLEAVIDPELLSHFQIIPSRVRKIEADKIRIYYAHDLPGDPEAEHLKNGGWKKFNKIVFVSHYQKNRYLEHYSIPASHCIVLQNAIEPLEKSMRTAAFDETIRLVYHTTPHRGLRILQPVFEKLCEKHKDIHLDVFSSFGVYGWTERDDEFKDVIDKLNGMDQVTYHGAKPNQVVREFLETTDIFAYPSIWPETSCLALMEAMSAGLLCVHSDLAALPETASNFTFMYPFDEDVRRHASLFYSMLDSAIDAVREGGEDLKMKLATQKAYTDSFYSMALRGAQWTNFLTRMKEEPVIKPEPVKVFSYKT